MWSQEKSRADTSEPQRAMVREASGQQATAKESSAAKLGSSVCLKGELTGSEDLTVDGTVQGRIELPGHTVTIGPNANVRADIVAKVVRVFGSVVGGVTAQETVDIRRGGSLAGQVACGRIAMQDGAHLSGKVQMPSPARKHNKHRVDTDLSAIAAVGMRQ